MKNVTKILMASALALATSAAFAEGESVPLTVTGSITPAACTPSLTGGGKFEWGPIQSSTLSPTSINTLPEKELTLTVTCAAPTRFGLTATDYKEGTALGAGSDDFLAWRQFGVGEVKGVKVGSLNLTLKNAMGDGESLIVLSNATGPAVFRDDNYIYRNGVLTAFTNADRSKNAFSSVTATLVGSAAINRTDVLPLEESVPIDGSAVIEVKYL